MDPAKNINLRIHRVGRIGIAREEQRQMSTRKKGTLLKIEEKKVKR